MLSGDGNENKQKKSVRLISKNNFARAAHFFIVHFFAIVLHDYDEKLPETSCLHVLCVPVPLFLPAAI